MKSKIFIKLYLIMVFMVISLFLLGALFNKVYLQKYYKKKNRMKLEIVNKEVQEKFWNGAIIDKDYYRDKYNVRVEFINIKQMGNQIKKRLENFTGKMPFNITKREEKRFNNYIRNLRKNDLKRLNRGEVIFREERPTGSNMDFLILADKIDHENILIVSNSVASIREAAEISFEFFTIISLVTLILGTIIFYFISLKITKPIKELNDMTKELAHFDFSKKSSIKTGDELEELGNSINFMADELEMKINDLNSANIQLKEEIEKEKKLIKMRREFVSNISHELKTPIAIIGGYAEGLKDNVVNDEESKNFYADVIMDETKNMTNLVKELLNYSLLNSDTMKMNFENFDLNDTCNSVLNRYRHILKEKDVTVLFSSKDSLSIVKGDRNRIEDAFNNYLSNAVNYVDNRGKIYIEIKDAADESYCVSVINTGEEIPSEKIEHLWDPFYRIDSSRNRQFGGTGLGLSIVKSIIDKHNGRFGAGNTDRGVEFWFSIKK